MTMPELPEVETIRLELQNLIQGKKIKSVTINLAKQVKGDRKEFLKVVTGAKVVAIQRRAKIIIFDLNNGWHLIFHLKLTGQLIYRSKNGKVSGGGHPIQQDLRNLPNKYSHVIFNFTDGSRLFFNDLRQFGWVKVVDDKELQKMDTEFGPEPLDKKFTLKYFSDFLARRSTAIKPLLMEQRFIAGLGNIYAQEVCFCAGISPQRSANKIKLAEIKKLYNCIKKILRFAIKKKGTSTENYIDAFGREGKMENFLKVYGRAGRPCQRCKAVLKSIKQGQRTTIFCPKCQK